jgi:hypothetical protein
VLLDSDAKGVPSPDETPPSNEYLGEGWHLLISEITLRQHKPGKCRGEVTPTGPSGRDTPDVGCVHRSR